MIPFLALILLTAAGTALGSQEGLSIQLGSKPPTSKPIQKKVAQKKEVKKLKKGDLRTTTKPSTRISELDYNGLKEKRDTCLKNKDKETALKYAERMIPMCDDLAELSVITLETADLMFEMGKLERAGKMYLQFADLYPGSAQTADERALYRAIDCNFKLIYDAEHDQTRTHKVIELADRFLGKAIYTTYKNEVAGIRTQCYQRLFDHEKNIVAFYLDQGKMRSAQTRLANVRKEFLDKLPACEKTLLEMEIECAMKTNNIPLVNEKSQQLAACAPETKTTLASTKPTRKSAVDKF